MKVAGQIPEGEPFLPHPGIAVGVAPQVAVSFKQCRSALNRSGIPGMDYCLNPYSGCAHGCLYCYASFMRRFLNVEQRWGSFVQVKNNFPERLAAELRRPKHGRVMLASVTDAYQPVEKRFGLTRSCLELLTRSELEVGILTKSDLVVRDLDLLARLPNVRVGFTLTVADDGLARLLEPGAPPPSRRLAAMAALARAGVRTWAFIAPVIPGLGDTAENLRSLLRAAKAAGAREVHFDPLNFYPTAVANLERVFSRHFPRRLGAWHAACRNPAAYRKRLARVIAELYSTFGSPIGRGDKTPPRYPRP